MPFVTKAISGNEKLLAIGSIHWIHVVKGSLYLLVPIVAWSILMNLLGGHVYPFLPDALSEALHLLLYYVFCAILFMGAIVFVMSFIHLMFTEIALTTKRIIYKTGWVFVRVKEVDLEEIKAADIDNGWLGRFLNYGYLILDSRFVGSMNLASIAHPYGFLRALNQVRGTLKQDTVNVVLEGHESLTPADVLETLADETPQPPPPKPRPPEPAPSPGFDDVPPPTEPTPIPPPHEPTPIPQPTEPTPLPPPTEPTPIPFPPSEVPPAPPAEVPVQTRMRLHDKILRSFYLTNKRPQTHASVV